jgi:DNA-binding CsgD family transcriptional regulator
MNRNGLAAIVSGAFDAALNDELWEPWFPNLASVLGGTGTVAFVIDAERQSIERPVSLWAPAKAIDEYLAGYWQYDSQLPIASSFEGLGTFVDLHDTDTSNPEVTDYLKWQRSIANADHQMTAVVPLGGGSQRLAYCIHRAPDLGPTPKHQLRALNRILPEIQRAAMLGFRHGEMLQSAFWDGIIVGRADQTALLLDEHGRVIRHTDAANKLISKRDGLDISGGKLRTLDRGDEPAFQSMIRQAIDAVPARSGAMRLTRPSGKLPLIAICYPLVRSSRMLAPVEAAALITIIDPNMRPMAPKALYREAFGLTAREAELAALLMSGHSVDSAAASLGMAMPTVRTHMRRLFEKTATSGQAALIRLLSQIASGGSTSQR